MDIKIIERQIIIGEFKSISYLSEEIARLVAKYLEIKNLKPDYRASGGYFQSILRDKNGVIILYGEKFSRSEEALESSINLIKKIN